MPVSDAEVMHLWRECGLPEWFLGNGGTNDKLVAFAAACASALSQEAPEWRALLTEARNEIDHYADTAREHDLVARIDAVLKQEG